MNRRGFLSLAFGALPPAVKQGKVLDVGVVGIYISEPQKILKNFEAFVHDAKIGMLIQDAGQTYWWSIKEAKALFQRIVEERKRQ